MKQNFCSKNRGFTLIDVVVVLAIILMFGEIVFVTYTNIMDNMKKPKVSEVAHALETVMIAAQKNYSSTSFWPSGMTTGSASGGFYDVCKNVFGVELPTAYVSAANYVATTADATTLTIQATFSGGQHISTNIDNTTITLSSGATGGAMTWGGTIPKKYRPK